MTFGQQVVKLLEKGKRKSKHVRVPLIRLFAIK
jgi:hypothetical protein